MVSRWAWMLLWNAIWHQLILAACSFSCTSKEGINSSSFRQQQQCHNSAAVESGSRKSDYHAPLPAASRTPTVITVDAATSSSSAAVAVLNFYANLDNLYDRSISIKCPFFRRRAADLIDGAAMLAQFLLIRHKSLPGISDLFLGNDLAALSPKVDGKICPASSVDSTSITNVFSAPGCKPLGRHIQRHPDGTARKTRDLPLSDIARRIRADWTGGVAGEGKGYYITGKLDSTIYKDDCLFTGPDPDMPVRGLRKYLSAAAHLFEPRESNAELLSMEYYEDGGEKGCGMVEVKWRLGGVIQLPWHPSVEPWMGMTLYHLNEEGLIYLHQEGWDISVWRAFICTLFPGAKNWRLWNMERITLHV